MQKKGVEAKWGIANGRMRVPRSTCKPDYTTILLLLIFYRERERDITGFYKLISSFPSTEITHTRSEKSLSTSIISYVYEFSFDRGKIVKLKC